MDIKDIVYDLRKILKQNGIDESTYTDHHLEGRFHDTVRDLEGMIGYSISPTTFTDIDFDFNHDTYLCDNYPVLDVKQITIDDKPIDKYKINKRSGVIRFNRKYRGDLEIEYEYGLNQKQVENEIYPLIYDMMSHRIINGNHNDITSMTLGDFSVSYSPNSQGLSKGIEDRILRLKSKYLYRVKFL